MAAYTCVLHAERCGSPGSLIERAKLLWQTGKRESALTCLDEGLGCFSGSTTGSASLANSIAMPPPPPTALHGGRQTRLAQVKAAVDISTANTYNKQVQFLSSVIQRLLFYWLPN